MDTTSDETVYNIFAAGEWIYYDITTLTTEAHLVDNEEKKITVWICM